MAFFCHQCGSALPPTARYCSNCGAVIAASQFVTGKPLFRPRAGRQIAGVCLAFSRTYGWDVTVVRVVAVLTLFFSSGLIGIAYLAAWIGIPDEPINALPPAV
jgi:phage shock protein C